MLIDFEHRLSDGGNLGGFGPIVGNNGKFRVARNLEHFQAIVKPRVISRGSDGFQPQKSIIKTPSLGSHRHESRGRRGSILAITVLNVNRGREGSGGLDQPCRLGGVNSRILKRKMHDADAEDAGKGAP